MQPASGFTYTSISGGVGTTVVKDTGAYLKRVIIPGTYVGTLVLHNAPSAAGTNATSPIVTLGLPTVTYPTYIDLDVNCGRGLVYAATGTPVVTLVWS